jgi:cytosine/creatinine deaminase
MTLDLLVTNACLPDGRNGLDIACRDGRIVAVERGIEAEAAGSSMPAAGWWRRPSSIRTSISTPPVDGLPRLNRSGTLLEGIALWGELKPLLTPEAVIERALRYCDLAVSQGLLAIRSHVDVCDDRLVGVEALLEVRRQVSGYLDLQLVAFPQDGYFRSPRRRGQSRPRARHGRRRGRRHPAFRAHHGGRNCERHRAVRDRRRRGLPVDMHCDESDDPASRHIETLAAETRRLGLAGRVAGSHLTSMHSMDNYYVSKLLPLMAEAGVAAIANPLINIVIQGRHDTYPKRRGMTRVPELLAAGIPVAFGGDCVMDPWYPLGQADMLEVAAMGLHVAQLTSLDDMAWCFEAVTTQAARIIGLEGYGLEVGCNADMVLLQARDPIEAIRLKPPRLAVIRRGKVIAETAERSSRLALDGRPASLDPRLCPGGGSD